MINDIKIWKFDSIKTINKQSKRIERYRVIPHTALFC